MKIRSKIATTLGVAGAIVALTAGPAMAAPDVYWAGGKCSAELSLIGYGDPTKAVMLRQHNGGMVQMSVHMQAPYYDDWMSATANDGTLYRTFSHHLDLTIHTFCKVNGEFRIGPVLHF